MNKLVLTKRKKIMFYEEKYQVSDVVYPLDYEEVMEELHEDEFDCDDYFGATVDILDLDTGYQFTVLLSYWFELNETTNYQHNFILVH